MASGEWQGRIDDLIARPMSREEALAFSHFDPAENERASELAAELSATARERGIEGAIDRAHAAAEEESIGVVKHAVKLFVTHDPEAATSLTVASPEPVDSEPIPSPDRASPPPGAARPADTGGAGAGAPPAPPPAPVPAIDVSRHTPSAEAALDWYREDPFANDHHHHWHLVYPSKGTPPENRTQPRQGELFFYMHQQMLARYDTERTLAGLQPAVPFVRLDGGVASFDFPIAEGYALQEFGPRPENTTPTNPPPDPPDAPPLLDTMSQIQAIATKAVRDGQIAGRDPTGATVRVPVDENVLGCFIEPSDLYRDGKRIRMSGAGLHGTGHNLVAFAGEDPGPHGFGGPMYYFESAIRDPVFYRWHRNIDNPYAALQEKAGPQDLGQFAADVEFRKQGAQTTDIALVLARDIAGSDRPGFDFAAWGEQELGVDLDGAGPATDTLLTFFTRSTIELPDVERVPMPDEWLQGVVHLKHEEVVYFLRLQNTRQAPQDVTVRLFLAHEQHAEERRMWIELDKFVAALKPGPNLVARPDARSAVVKRKGLARQGVRGAAPDPAQQPGETTVWCDCGWPYTLLLPSGASTSEGTRFKLMACVTDHASDQLGRPQTCGSMSFCGARGEYPDRRTMGYPFDRPFAGTIEDAIAGHASMAMRDVQIRCATQRPAST